MDRIANPYRPGAGTPPVALVGRDDLIEDFRVSLRRALAGNPGRSCMPIGLRGVGKTVLLNRFVDLAMQEVEVKVAFIEACQDDDFRMVLAIRLRKVLLELSREPFREPVARALAVLRSFCVQLPGGSSVALGVDALAGEADSGVLSEDLTDLLVAVGKAVAACESGLLIAIDEIQQLDLRRLGALVAAVHRTTQLKLPLVLVGAGLPLLPGRFGETKSYIGRLFEFPNIDSLAPEDAAEAITAPAAELSVSFEPAAVVRIVEESQGYPYLLQQWGHHVWNTSPASPITDDDVRAIRWDVIATLGRDFFRARLDRLTPKEGEYLRAMADLGPGPHRSGDIATRLGVRVESVAPRRSSLITKGMIYSPVHGDTAFTVPLFDDYLRRSHDDDGCRINGLECSGLKCVGHE